MPSENIHKSNIQFAHILLWKMDQKANLFWAINTGHIFQTSGLFLLGFYIGRNRFFVS